MNITMEKFEYPKTLIKEFKFWTVQLRPAQVTLGSLVLINKSEAKHLGELSNDEWAEFAEVSSFAEELLRRHFSAEKFHYMAYMLKDPNVHFHFIPRYFREIEFAGKKFIADSDQSAIAQLQAIEMDEEVFGKLLEKLKS